MKSRFTRRSLLAGTTAVSATLVIKTGRAAEYTFVQYHNQAATGTLHKNLTSMWEAVRAETNGRVEATVHAENNKISGGDPDALKMLLGGEIQFFTLMGGIIGTVVPVAEAQQVPFAFKSAADAHKAIDGPFGRYRRGDGGEGDVSLSGGRFRQWHAAGGDDPSSRDQAGRLRRNENTGPA